jgi:hypothetical protein
MNKQSKILPVNPKFQFALSVANLIFMVIFTIIFHKTFFSEEYWPKENKIQKTNTGLKHKIKFEIQDILDIDFIREGKAIFWMKISFSLPKNISNKFDHKKFIENISIKNGKILEKKIYNPIEKNEITNYKAICLIQTKNIFQYKNFPFDDHILPIKLEFQSIEALENLEPILKVNETKDFGGWNPIKTQITENTNKDKDIKKINLYIALNKQGYRISLAIIFPMIIILLICLFSMSAEIGDGRKFIITALLALNSFRMVIENTSPKVSYLMIIDVIYIAFLVISLIIFLIHMLELEMKRNISYTVIVCSHLSILLIFCYYLLPWINIFFFNKI